MKNKRERERERERTSRPIRCAGWIVERIRYPTNRPTDQPTDQPTDIAYYRGAWAHLKNGRKHKKERKSQRT